MEVQDNREEKTSQLCKVYPVCSSEIESSSPTPCNAEEEANFTELDWKEMEAIEGQDKQKRRADNFQRRINILKRENEEEYEQYRCDMNLRIEEKNDLRASFLSQQNWQDDSVSMSDAEESSHKDYDIRKLNANEWVAVGYEEDFYYLGK
ncbi:hypothetical protein ACROYT_G014404 [Oculina patagonica]